MHLSKRTPPSYYNKITALRYPIRSFNAFTKPVFFICSSIIAHGNVVNGRAAYIPPSGHHLFSSDLPLPQLSVIFLFVAPPMGNALAMDMLHNKSAKDMCFMDGVIIYMRNVHTLGSQLKVPV